MRAQHPIRLRGPEGDVKVGELILEAPVAANVVSGEWRLVPVVSPRRGRDELQFWSLEPIPAEPEEAAELERRNVLANITAMLEHLVELKDNPPVKGEAQRLADDGELLRRTLDRLAEGREVAKQLGDWLDQADREVVDGVLLRIGGVPVIDGGEDVGWVSLTPEVTEQLRWEAEVRGTVRWSLSPAFDGRNGVARWEFVREELVAGEAKLRDAGPYTEVDIVMAPTEDPTVMGFVETELPDGRGVGIGHWMPDGTRMRLRIRVPSGDVRGSGTCSCDLPREVPTDIPGGFVLSDDEAAQAIGGLPDTTLLAAALRAAAGAAERLAARG